MAEIILMPKLGFDMKEGVLVRWVKLEGEPVLKGDVLAEIETDKATVEVETSFSGVMYKHLVEIDAIVPIGNPIAVIAAPDEKVDLKQFTEGSTPVPNKDFESEDLSEKQLVLESTEEDETDDRIKASPLARKMAGDEGIKLSDISGTGPGGRIVKKDIENALKLTSTAKVETAQVAEKETIKTEKTPDGQALPASNWGLPTREIVDVKVPMSKLRQAIGRRMVESKQQIPHFYATYDYNVSDLMNMRKQTNATLPDDQKLSVNDFMIKAVAISLRQYPNLNASLSEKDIIQHSSINIGVAVSVEGGLLTIVVKDADIKPIRMLSQEVKEMAGRVRSGKVRSEDVDGSTFSISNLGMYGVDEFTAIINPPEAAILAVSAAKQTPVVENGELTIGWRMKVKISADHRITDGAEAAQFLKSLAFQIENPIRLLL